MNIRNLYVGAGAAGQLPILNNNQYLQGYSTAAVAFDIIGVDGSDLISIDPAARGIVTGGYMAVGGLTSNLGSGVGFSVNALNSTMAQVLFERNTNDSGGLNLIQAKSRGGATVQNGDTIGTNLFRAFDGTAFRIAGAIGFNVDGVPGLAVMPTRLVISVNQGAAVLTEAFRISSTLVASFQGPVTLRGYTVATLPAGAIGQTAYVTDAAGNAFGVAVVGGGAFMVPVYFDGAAWIVG